MVIIDKKLYNKLRLKLLKEFRIKEFFSVSPDGYAIHKVKDGKFDLEIPNKKYNKDPIYIELDENDKDFGYETLNIMHRRHFYGKLNDNHTYPVTIYTCYSVYGDITIISPRIDINENYFKHIVKERIEKFIIEDNKGYRLSVDDFNFESLEDYKELLTKGYRIVGRGYGLNNVLTKKKSRLEFEIRERQKELESIDEQLDENEYKE